MSNDFTIVKKGYSPEEVDEYINTLELQINEYKEKGTAINKAIINAQIAADNIIKAAHAEAEKLLLDANTQADEIKHTKSKEIRSLKINIQNQKNLIQNFHEDYDRLISKYLNPIATNDIKTVTNKLTEIELILDELSSTNSPNPSYGEYEKRPKPEKIRVNRQERQKRQERQERQEYQEKPEIQPKEEYRNNDSDKSNFSDASVSRRRREKPSEERGTTLTEEEARALLS